jgi:anti-sigma regulatory factor (Ser/Thr protein kinase)
MKDFAIRNDLAELETLADAVVHYCRENRISDEISYEVRLALEEAVSNTIKYGYEDQQIHMIHIRIGNENHDLILEIEDDARAFNPLEAPDPDLLLPVEKKPIGQLGIYLMRAVMDDIDYKRTGDKNILQMKKRISVTDSL